MTVVPATLSRPPDVEPPAVRANRRVPGDP